MYIRTHTGEKYYQCEICDAKFSQIGHLNVHNRTHNNNYASFKQ